MLLRVTENAVASHIWPVARYLSTPALSDLYLVIFAVLSPPGAFGGLAPQTKLQAPQVEL